MTGPETVLPLDSIEILLRLTWWSQDLDDDRMLLPSAIRLDDLKGPEAGVSVDRESLCQHGIMASLASAQQPKSPAKRIKPHVSSVACGRVQAECDENGALFNVHADPIPDNPAHALISSTRVRKESERRALRIKLIALFGRAIALDEYSWAAPKLS